MTAFYGLLLLFLPTFAFVAFATDGSGNHTTEKQLKSPIFWFFQWLRMLPVTVILVLIWLMEGGGMEEILSTDPLLLTIGISLIVIMLLTLLGYMVGLFHSVMLGTLWIIPEFPFLQWVKPDREARKLQAAAYLFNCRVNGFKMQPFETFCFAKDLADFLQALDMAQKNWVNLSALHNSSLSSSDQFQKNLREQDYWVEEIAAPLYEKLQREVADERNTFHWPYAPDLRPKPRRDDQGASVPPYYILWDNVIPQTLKYLKSSLKLPGRA